MIEFLKNFPEVKSVVGKIGTAEIPTDPMPMEATDLMVILKDKKEWTSAKTFDELAVKMHKALEVVPGVTFGFQYPVQMRFNELMTGARQDVVCKIFGENLDTLTHYAAQLNGIIQTVDGAVNIYEEKVTGMPQVVIKYNRDGMAKYGLNVEDVNRVVNSAFAGQIAGQVYEEEKRFDMVVRLDGESRKSLADIQNLNITTANGMQIPLSFVAGIEEIEGVNQIQRENTKRRIIVGFNINGRDVQTIVNELQTKIGQQLNLQKGYTIVYGGSFENMTAAKNKLSIVVPIALFLIFLLLYFAFGSVKQGLLIYTAIPLSAMGGIMALWARSMPFSISAGVGFIALFGVAVLNGILLVTEFNRLKSEGWHDITRIVIHATKSKLRAVLMTALVPALGFIPMAISTGAGGEVQKPLATVVIGGLIISTLLTLFVLPVMYLLFEKGTKYLTMNKNASITILILLLFGQVSFAQNKISLTSAIDTALKNNTALRASNLNVDYYKALRKSNVDIDKTLFDFGYGKINSFQNDNRILISQNIQFPSVYKSQGAINKSNLLMSELSKLTNEIELKSLVKNKYYLLLVLQNKKQLLMQADSIYSAFVTKANQRYNAGGADVLEKVTAESQLAQISNQLQTLTLSYENSINEFNYLLNSTQAFEPASAKLEILLAQLPDVYAIQQTPIVQMGAQKVVLAENQQKLEKGKLQPDFNVGYNSSTIIGWQPTTQGSDSYFGSNHRFGAINLGLSIPIFSTAQKSKIAASKVQIEQNKLENIALQQQLNSNFKNLLNSYLQNKKLVMAYEKNTLPNAALLIETAGRKMTAGEITYLEWVMIINQAIQIKSEYLNYIQQLNENAIELEKLTATK